MSEGRGSSPAWALALGNLNMGTHSWGGEVGDLIRANKLIF